MTLPWRHACRSRILALLALVWLAPSAWAAQATEELLRLVPEDAALCLIVQDLRGHSKQLAESPFLEQLRQSPLAKLLPAEAAGLQLAEFDKVLQANLQTNLAEIRDEIVGDAVVLAFWPGAAGIGERALILTKARKPELATSLVQRLQRMQLQSGELQRVEPLQHRGFKYMRCLERNDKTSYQLVHNGLIVLAQDEPTLQHVIQVLADHPPGNPIARQLNELGVLDAFGIFWINPRAFDGEMAAKAKIAEGNEAAFLKNFQTYWKSTKVLVVALRLAEDADLSLHVRLTLADLPPAARLFFNQASKPSNLWPLLPKDSILAISGRWSPSALFEMLTEFSSEEARKKALQGLSQGSQALLGLDLQKELLPGLGPDMAAYVGAPPAEQKGWFPDVLLAIRVRPVLEGANPEALTDALKTIGGLLALSRTNEGKATSIKTTLDGQTKIVFLASEQGFPSGFQPAGAVKNGCLLLASSPDAIRRFGLSKDQGPASGNTPVLLARISAKHALHSYLSDNQRRQELATALALSHQTTADDVEAKLTVLQGILKLFDSLELVQHAENNQTTLTLHLRTAQPLKKGN